MSFSPTLLLNVTGFSVRFLGLHRVLSVLLVFFYRVFPRFERVTIFRRGGGSLTGFFVVLPDWMPWFTEFFLPGFRLVSSDYLCRRWCRFGEPNNNKKGDWNVWRSFSLRPPLPSFFFYRVFVSVFVKLPTDRSVPGFFFWTSRVFFSDRINSA